MPAFPDLNWINVQDADEAWKLLKLGRKNQSFASTHMNQNSSRRSEGRGALFRQAYNSEGLFKVAFPF